MWREREREERREEGITERGRERERFFKELAYTTVEACKSEICKAGWEPREELMLQS